MWPHFLFVLVLLLAVLVFYYRKRGNRLQWESAQKQTQINHLGSELQRALDDAGARQEALFNSMMEGVLILDLQQRVVLVNQTLSQWFALKEKIDGLSLMEVFRSHELQDLIQKTAASTEATEKKYELLESLPHRILRVQSSTIRSQDGTAQGTIVVFHDLTQLKRLEKMRQEFVANVSHELRTPLHIIQGSLETVQSLPDHDSTSRHRFLEIIGKHIDRLAHLIEDLLILSQIDSGHISLHLQREELLASVQRVIDDLQPRALQREIELCNQITPDVYVRADGRRLQQILFNLVDNAIQYGHPQGRVEIGARSAGLQMVEIWVRDNGPGIPAEAAERIFERFFRLDRARSRDQGGTGLGLSIVKNLVQAQGGKVWIDPQVQDGASFHFTLPNYS